MLLLDEKENTYFVRKLRKRILLKTVFYEKLYPRLSKEQLGYDQFLHISMNRLKSVYLNLRYSSDKCRTLFIFSRRYEMLRTRDGSIRGSIKLIESLKTRKGKGKKNKDGKGEDWTWKELADMVKYTKVS